MADMHVKILPHTKENLKWLHVFRLFVKDQKSFIVLSEKLNGLKQKSLGKIKKKWGEGEYIGHKLFSILSQLRNILSNVA